MDSAAAASNNTNTTTTPNTTAANSKGEEVLLRENETSTSVNVVAETKSVLFAAQWVYCDLRYFDMTVLGKFSVIMADPPWDIRNYYNNNYYYNYNYN